MCEHDDVSLINILSVASTITEANMSLTLQFNLSGLHICVLQDLFDLCTKKKNYMYNTELARVKSITLWP